MTLHDAYTVFSVFLFLGYYSEHKESFWLQVGTLPQEYAMGTEVL